MRHANEPTLEELKKMRTELYTAPSTNDNLRKIKAIEVQITRHEPAESNQKKS
jgi:hypothetical protein